MRYRRSARAGLIATAALMLATAIPVSAATTWHSGIRTYGQVAVEPAVDMATGHEIFLLTPMGAKTNANPRAHAPLYLVLYPTTSTLDPSTLNCTPTNCDHAQSIPGLYSFLGHDHLVGIPPTGDWNVAWDVYPIIFTPAGFADGAINHRILTSDDLAAALAAHDVVQGPLVLSFNCSRTSIATYLKGTLLGS